MKTWATIALRGVFYTVVVLSGVTLLAFVQLRSSGGATFDTWRLNHEANLLLNSSLLDKIQKAEQKGREDANSLNSNQVCLRLLDENGVPKLNLVDKQTVQEVEKARQERTPSESLFGEVFCLVKRYTYVQNDINYFKRLVEEDASEITSLKQSYEARCTACGYRGFGKIAPELLIAKGAIFAAFAPRRVRERRCDMPCEKFCEIVRSR